MYHLIMLVLSRKEKEKIIINDNIIIEILQINKREIKLGITAPKEIDIKREEIYIKKADINN